MPNEEFFEAANEERREQLRARLKQKQAEKLFQKIGEPITPFRARTAGESLEEYKLYELNYYRDILETRWTEYLTSIEKDMQARFRSGGVGEAVNAAAKAYYDIPEEIPQYDLYSVESYSGMRKLEELIGRVDMNDMAIAEWLETSAFRHAREAAGFLKGRVDNSMRVAVNDAMQAKLRTPGYSLQDFINDTAPYMDETRAQMIARTESTRAVNKATEDLARSMEAAGYQVVEIWKTKQSTTVCPDCAALEGRIRGDGWYEYPPLHPNCDCDVYVKLRDREGNIL